tara:strand:+ start:992 stop:1315 length:324 start_codon:yes stop_codon:yes gene_type:complete
MENITNVITDFYTDMIKKLLINIENKNNRICNLVRDNDELEEKNTDLQLEIEKLKLENKELGDKCMNIAIENEELEEKYNSLEENYNEIETDLINLEKKNYFEKINK